MAKIVPIVVLVRCPTEEGAARALEVLSRPLAGLVLEGDFVAIITRGEDDD